MIKPLSQVVLVVGLSLAASASSHSGVVALPVELVYALTAVDALPNETQLNALLPGGQVAQHLLDIANDVSVNAGVRVRAIRALGQLPRSEPVRDAIKMMMIQPDSPDAGAREFLVIAAVETLGNLRDGGDVGSVAPLLMNGSRDIRVAAARALRNIGDASALDALRARQNNESVLSVKVAILEAIQALGQAQ